MKRNVELLKMTNFELSELGKKLIDSGNGVDEILVELQNRSSNLAKSTFEEIQSYALRAFEKSMSAKYKGTNQKAIRTTSVEKELYPHFISYLQSNANASEYIFQTRTNLLSGKWSNPDAYKVTFTNISFNLDFHLK